MTKELAYFLQQILNTVQLATFYVPLAVAFALIQAITRKVFLSFGDVAMFDGDKLSTLTVPEDLPTEAEFVAAISTFKPSGTAPKLALTDEERKALPVPVRTAAPAAVDRKKPKSQKSQRAATRG